jgi:hypothetical protein
METNKHPLIGKVVRDNTVEHELLYLVGERSTGFMALGSGIYFPYSSTFPGPEWFDRPEFDVVSSWSGS